MTLTFCSDLAAADWIVHSSRPWQQLVCFGPAGFDAYARLRLLPDPAHPGQSESDAEVDDWRIQQLPSLFQILATRTTTPHDCYFCVWDGLGQAIDTELVIDAEYMAVENPQDQLERAPAKPGLAPRRGGSPSIPPAPKVAVPNRAYWLFRGPLAEIGSWDIAQGWPGRWRLDETEPAFVWPADHAWCVARDVDPHWAGIGGHTLLIDQLITDRRLDVVLADPTTKQPSYQ